MRLIIRANSAFLVLLLMLISFSPSHLLAQNLNNQLGISGNVAAASTYTYTFTNRCEFPVWVAQTADISNGKSYPPVGGNWALAPSCSSNAQCGTGMSCNIGQCSCNTDTDCPGSATCTNSVCSTTAVFNIPQNWKSGTFWPRTECNVPSNGELNCKTGQCTPKSKTNGLLNCGVGITSPSNPVTQFEVTSTTTTVNYDVSIVAGYNVELKATPVGGRFVEPGKPVSDAIACYDAGCSADLNLSCPANLQLQDSTGTVIGCLDTCTQCQRTGPQGSTPNPTVYAALKCNQAITMDVDGNSPAATTLCNGQTGNTPIYQDMYCVQNFTDSTANAQASSNQGTPTAFGQDDCFPGLNFVEPTYASGYTPPSGQGVCLYTTPPQSTTPGFNDYGWFDYAAQKALNCSNFQDGSQCGGYLTTSGSYPDGLDYSCQTATFQDSQQQTLTAHLCMPPTTSGLGACVNDSNGKNPLYSAVGGVMNASWLTAGIQAGSAGTPYYETFKAACESAYTWQYDDASSGFGCDVTARTGGQAFSGFAVTFCGN